MKQGPKLSRKVEDHGPLGYVFATVFIRWRGILLPPPQRLIYVPNLHLCLSFCGSLDPDGHRWQKCSIPSRDVLSRQGWGVSHPLKAQAQLGEELIKGAGYFHTVLYPHELDSFAAFF